MTILVKVLLVYGLASLLFMVLLLRWIRRWKARRPSNGLPDPHPACRRNTSECVPHG